MKKRIFRILIFIAIIAGVLFILNIDTTTKQCVNYECRAIKIPLYLKISGFLDRHLNYKRLAGEITGGIKSEEERVRRILVWTQGNLKKAPAGLPIVDDHVWYIVIRGYGVDDQFQDVFTTLCNYAGLEAFFTDLRGEKSGKRKSLSFVKIGRIWTVIDAYNGVSFRNNKGGFAGIEELENGRWNPQSIEEVGFIDYQDYFRSLTSIDLDTWHTKRSAIQSPLHRLIYWFRHKKSKINFTFFK